MRHIFSQKIDDIVLAKQRILSFLSNYEIYTYLDTNFYAEYKYSNYELLAAFDATSIFSSDDKFDFEKIFKSSTQNKDWLFGFFSYNLKNKFQALSSKHIPFISFPDSYFFIPKYVIYIPKNSNEIFISSWTSHAKNILFEIMHHEVRPIVNNTLPESKKFQAQISHKQYIETVHQIQACIAKGDFYELNFCMEYILENVRPDFYSLFEKINRTNKAPFSACCRFEHLNIACTSPERFLMKQQQKIIAQPIKGTAKKCASAEANQKAIEQLSNSIKERAENVMIVDLVRNDLSHYCQAGSVEVEELCKIYHFEQVHHLISIISGILEPHDHHLKIFKNTFPPGSMTGAPKFIVMKKIEEFENFNRGLYSGSIGYFRPDGNFDFNVVIRSIFYDAQQNKLSCHTGSAITYDSEAEAEYNECIAKAEAMFFAIQ